MPTLRRNYKPALAAALGQPPVEPHGFFLPTSSVRDPEISVQHATSLKITIGKQIDRAELVAKILYYLEKFSNQYIAEGFTNIKALWEEYSCTIGSRIKATTLRDVFVGKAIGITNEGILKLQLDDGTIKEIYSADIELEK